MTFKHATPIIIGQKATWRMLRIGRASVAIRRLWAGIDQLRRDPAGQEPAGKIQLARDQLIAQDRHSTERGFLCL